MHSDGIIQKEKKKKLELLKTHKLVWKKVFVPPEFVFKTFKPTYILAEIIRRVFRINMW